MCNLRRFGLQEEEKKRRAEAEEGCHREGEGEERERGEGGERKEREREGEGEGEGDTTYLDELDVGDRWKRKMAEKNDRDKVTKIDDRDR